MAWGIMMTAVTLVGMLGLVIFKIGQEAPSLPSEDPAADASTAIEQRRAA
jgi:hypothetical protein